MWAEVYDHVWSLRYRRPELAKRIYFVRYEALCRAPRAELARILEFTDLSHAGVPILDDLAHFRAPAAAELTLADEERAAVWSEVADVAERFGWARATSKDLGELHVVPAVCGGLERGVTRAPTANLPENTAHASRGTGVGYADCPADGIRA